MIFSYFSFFFLFFWCFSFFLFLCQAIFRWLVSFSTRFFFVSKESTLHFLKKIQVQIIFFNKKAVTKIYMISNSKSAPWNLVKFRSEFFLVNASRIVYWILLVLIANNCKTKKNMCGSRNIAKKTELVGRDFFYFEYFFYFCQTKIFLFSLKTDKDQD